MSKLLHKCNACSDIHATVFPTAISGYTRDAQNGIFSICCGDFLTGTGGLFNADNTPTKNLIRQFVALKGGVVVGNHDAGQHSTMPREKWEALTRQALLSEKVVDGVHYIFISGNKAGGALSAAWDDGKPIYPEDVRTQAIELLTAAKAAGGRCIVITHYPLEQGTTDGNGFAFRVGQPRGTGTPYKPTKYTSTAYFAKDSNGHSYDTDFYNQIAGFDNVLWLSGHTHVNWRYQTGLDDGVNVNSNGIPIPYPNQKAYKKPNGAAMINLPSANYQAQDARIEVYNDRIIIRARENGTELGGEYNYTWYTDGTLVKNAAEPTIDTDPEPTVYSISVVATGCTVAGASTITEGKTATLTITAEDGYALPDAMTVTGASYTWNKATGALVLSSPTGAVHVTVTAEKLPSVYSITVAASGCTVSGTSTITEGGTATLTATVDSGYSLPDAVTVTGASHSWNSATGVLVLSSPTGAVHVTVTAVKEAEPEPIPLFDRFGNRLSLQQLWIWKDGAITHPTNLYDAASNVIAIGYKHYGARWDKVHAKMARLYDAESFPTDITNFAHRGSVNANYSNPFDNIYPWAGIKLCNISIDLYRNLAAGDSITKCVTAWEGDANFSYNDANGVWRYRPEFWGRSWEDDTYRYFDVSQSKRDLYVYYPEAIVGRWHGRNETRTIDGEEKGCLIPSVGMPAKNIPMSTLHTYAKNYGATLDSIYSVDADTLLCIVEFATMNTQNAIGNGVSHLYRQSPDLIQGDVTNSTTVKVLAATGRTTCIPGAIFDIGTLNGGTQVGSFIVVSATPNADDAQYLDVTLNQAVTVTGANYWSVHGLANVADEGIGSKSGYIGASGKCNAYYRGIVMFGNMWFYILGAYENKGNHHIWIANSDEEADNHDVLDTTVHYDTGLVLSTAGGFIKKLGLLSRSGFLSIPAFCVETGGDSDNPVGDRVNNSGTSYDTILILGGSASNGSSCGMFYCYWDFKASSNSWSFSARPRLKNP